MYKVANLSKVQRKELFSETATLMNTTNAIVAKRTFWEKATILHHEANRPKDSLMPTRYSRHYYDLAMMAKDKVKNEALSDFELLKNVVEFKEKFYPRTWAKYEEAKKGTFKLLPPIFRLDDLEKDYKAMGNMIFDKKISFTEIIELLKNLEIEINKN
ncbi:MAG: nucleotidyl transferase AbiEii/AbiGii toxin family protein [Aliarcobacter skirrowii]|uniref:nucleotidyl transferase AbiEii/AbiGii toxin family protein n=1 Tax=Aliarcobacter skirrowii TaxID=28200 RepID=UPI00243234C6|nr:nucleotidyl transferase AbiEii/AbiGii toxin family protein [Aliarcobacter skirrowii]MDD3497828.1 nucleotidyl transferase AbiEii/AbiGii toxin family protein [Aliarcobacter skirrowii]